jgi:hypothetical protein
MKEDVAFRLKQAETAGLGFELSMLSVEMNYEYQLRPRRNTLI